MVSAVEQPPRYRRVVDGHLLPVSIAERPALDFCNTLAGWNADAPHEYLVSYAHLAVWAREAGLLDARSTSHVLHLAEAHPRAAQRQLQRACALRDALYVSCTVPTAATAWRSIAAEVRRAASQAVLAADAPPGRRWSISPAAGLARPVLELAREAGELLATTELRHVKACPGTGCGWLFLDSSGRRRWCTMEVCGNRAKARRHAERVRRARRARSGA